MGTLKHYLNDLICQAAPEDAEGQDAIAWAITTGMVKPGCESLRADVKLIRENHTEIMVAYFDQVAHEESELAYAN